MHIDQNHDSTYLCTALYNASAMQAQVCQMAKALSAFVCALIDVIAKNKITDNPVNLLSNCFSIFMLLILQDVLSYYHQCYGIVGIVTCFKMASYLHKTPLNWAVFFISFINQNINYPRRF